MPEESKDKTFTQEEVNAIAAQARKDGRDAASKDLLKTIGVDSVEAVQAAVKEAKDLKAAGQTEIERTKSELAEMTKKVNEANAASADAVKKLKAVTLERNSEVVAGELGVDPVKAKQILKLLDIGPDTFDESSDIKKIFTDFLAQEENKHFVTPAKTALPEGAKNKPPAGGGSGDNKFTELMNSMTSIR
jgi:hypothetical protein